MCVYTLTFIGDTAYALPFASMDSFIWPYVP